MLGKLTTHRVARFPSYVKNILIIGSADPCDASIAIYRAWQTKNVLTEAIQTGVNSEEYFAIASGFDGTRYIDLKFNVFIG